MSHMNKCLDKLRKNQVGIPSTGGVRDIRGNTKTEKFLCLLYRFYNNSAKDLTAIFNYLFQDRLE
jgi:hypothetical protein